MSIRALPSLVGSLLGWSALLAHDAAAQTLVARLNCGGPAIALPNGEAWAADTAYGSPPSAGFVGGAPVTVVTSHQGLYVGGFADPHAKLHATGRQGWQAYRFDVAPGDYIVRLHVAELTLHGPTLRLFDVAAEGVPLLADLDLAAQLGVQYAGIFAARVSVSDGRLDVTAGGADPALLSGIEVFTAPAGLTAPPPVTGLTASGSYGRNIVTWTPSADPAITGYRVSRAAEPHGSYALLGVTWAAPARWLDDDVVAGESRSYRVAAVNAAGLAGPVSSIASATPLAAAESALPVYTLELAPADLALIDAAVLVDDELTVPAVFGFDGRTWNVQVRYRGATALTFSKKSWKVKFPSDDTFQGQTALNLKAHFADGSLLREPLALDLAHAIGHPAADHAPVHLQVNGVYRGVFDSMEQIEVEYLKARDRDPGGSIYQVDSNFGLLSDPSLYAAFYEKKTNESTGNADLVALIQLIHDTPAADMARVLAGVLDVDNLLSYYALIGAIADEDSIRHNGYLLHDLSLGRWEFIAWDNESCLGVSTTGAGPALPIDFGTQAAGVPFNSLKTAVLDVPAFRWRYAEKLAALLDGAAAPPALSAAIDAGHGQLAADAAADGAKFGWESAALFDAAPPALKQFIAARTAFLHAALPGYQPPLPPTTVWINEFMADNVGTLADEAGDFEDWIELFNATGAPASVGGL
ncbi:MAG TPA: CotH kinase family protein, partial [Planctomycetota bacterium]|nr:CotH kinase family protein [Planctomycetota bacterium]